MVSQPPRPSFGSNGAAHAPPLPASAHRPDEPTGAPAGSAQDVSWAAGRAGAAVRDGATVTRAAPPPYRLPSGHADRRAERQLRERLRAEVTALLGARQLVTPGDEEREAIRKLIADRVFEYDHNAANTNAPQLADAKGVEQRLYDHLLGLGPIQSLMDDPRIEEIICNGADRAFVVVDGEKRQVDGFLFDSDEELYQLVKRLIGPLGRRLDESSPMVDARLPDGSRLNAAIPPAATNGCSVTIRKFVLRAESLQQLVSLGTLPQDAARFLEACVQAGVNIVVSGPTGAGKTTLLNALGACIASVAERVVTVEEVAELRLHGLPDWVGLQARAANAEGAGEIRIRELVRNALRMRPTRIVVGECRGGEALDMLLALNTGHDGSLTTVHGNSPRDALDRLATLAMMAEERLGLEAITRMIARTVELVLQLGFEHRTGTRRLTSIFEVTGTEGSVVSGNELWRLSDGGRLEWTGVRPRCLRKIGAAGLAYALPPAAAVAERHGERG